MGGFYVGSRTGHPITSGDATAVKCRIRATVQCYGRIMFMFIRYNTQQVVLDYMPASDVKLRMSSN